jgi:amino acid adenylation domain-containing protein
MTLAADRQDNEYELDFGERAMWFLYELAPASTAYNGAIGVRLRAPMRTDLLRRALAQLVDRHPLLRARYLTRDGVPVHHIDAHTASCFEEIDATHWSGSELDMRIDADVRRPFVLESGPILRTCLYTRSVNEHVLLITAHHIVADLWSLGIVLDELLALYTAEASGVPSTLPPLAMRHADYVAWQRDMLVSPEGERMMTYWQRQLAGPLPILDLPLDHPRPPVLPNSGDSVVVKLPPSLPQRLGLLAKKHGVSGFMAYLAAFQTMLHRYTGQEDIIVGSPVSGRGSHPALGTIIANFVNTLPMRTDLAGNPRFTELLARLREVVTEARAHQEYPLSQMVEKLQPVRDPSRSPVFQAIFSIQRIPAHDWLGALCVPAETGHRFEVGGLVLEPVPVRQQEGQADLSLYLSEVGNEIYCDFKYSPALFETATIERMAAHYIAVLESVVQDPEQRIGNIPLLGADERHRVLLAWNDTQVEFPLDTCFSSQLEAQVERTPDAIAVSNSQGERLTYAELNRRANRLAHRLEQHGVGPEVLVALLMDRGVELLASILAVFKAGGAYLPLDPAHPPHRMAQILASSGASCVLAEEAFLPHLAQVQAELPPEHEVPVMRVADTYPHLPAHNLPPCAGPNALAYVIYTSGSTGIPKGAMVEQQGMLNHLHAKIRDLVLTDADVVAQNASQCFDISVWQMLAALLVGGRVHIVDNAIAHDARRLLGALAPANVSILEVVPSMLRMMLDEIEIAGGRAPALPALRWLIPTGEALPPELCRAWLRHYPNIPLLNAYGPTECSDDVTHYPIHAPPAADVINMPIGRPIANMRLYVLDVHRQPVPLGVRGELYVGGVGVGRGYRNDDARTAEVFLPDPFSEAPRARLYRTGDVGRYLPDGNIEFLGRVDYQVKIRGFRIELGEIEVVLASHPQVRQAVVLAREDIPGDRRLVAYVVAAAAGARPSQSELRDFMTERLPGYMVPAAVMVLDALPLTPNSKVDRKALPAPDLLPEVDAAFVAPRTPIEVRLAEIWTHTLGAARVGIHDNFFALGGHSLVAMQLMARIRAACQVDVPLNSLFETPTIAEQAALIVSVRGAQANSQTPAEADPVLVPDPAHRHLPFPLTDLQQAYWLGQNRLLAGSQTAAIGYIELEVEHLDSDRFARALNRVIARHDMLRAVVRNDGQQQVLPEVSHLSVEVMDLRGRPEDEVASILASVHDDLSRVATPTDRWPLLRLRVHHLDHAAYRIHFGFPLLLGDERSYQVFNDELARLYQDPEAQLEPLTLTFRDYVQSRLAMRHTEAFRRSEAYWNERLPMLPPAPQLPLGRPPDSLARLVFHRRSGRLAPELWRTLKERFLQAGVTPTAALGAAFAEILARWSKSPHFTLNVLLQDRPPVHEQIQAVIGNFATTLLIEADHRTVEPFVARARRLHARLWNDMEHSQVSGVQLIRKLASQAGTGASALMPIVFASDLNVGHEAASMPACLGSLVARRTQTPHVWLDHQVFEEHGALGFHWDVVEEMFPAGMIDAMFASYQMLLHALAQAPNLEHVPGVPLPPGELEARQLANATETPLGNELLHELFFAQAAIRPDAQAVVDSRRSLTYGELCRKVWQVGNRLRELGVRPNTLVAVVMSKGWEQVVATLGIQAAGGAYLPIDPELPAERLQYLIAHGEVEIALTQPWLEQQVPWPVGLQRLVVDDATLAGASEHPLERAQEPGDLAYVIFTSGSTGLPKGVMIDHRGAVNTIHDINERFAVGPGDRVLALSSLSFDLSVYDIFGTLAAGGTIVVPDAAATRDPAHWGTLVTREQVTMWSSVPALMQLLVEYLAERPGVRLPLRLVMLSGDWVPVTLPDRIRRLAERVSVVSLGGATEGSIWSIFYPIDRVDPSWKSIPYGRPMRNQQFHVLDHALEPCPLWVTGELYIGGAGVARGYWRDPHRTAERFRTHPRTGERLYRTGDLGRYLPDGNIEFLGREDFQVKVQGYRIELGEIEATLKQHSGVRTAVVIAQGEQRGDKRLVAYVVPATEASDTGEVTPGDYRRFVQDKLPAYMVPSSFILLDDLPLTSNGKVDRKALLTVGQQVATRTQTRAVEPRDAVELQLVRIWEELLDIHPVGVTDNFFDLGGHSFAAVRMIAAIHKQFGRELSLTTLIQEPTVEHLASSLRQGSASRGQSPLVPLHTSGTRIPFFCIHPVGGNVMCYVALARLLGEDQPFYGLQSQGLDDERAPLTDLASMATAYVAAMRQVQPEGPYLMGGWSMGGVVAFEMAAQLRQAGQRVALLALMDSRIPDVWADTDHAQLMAWFLRDLGSRFGTRMELSSDGLRHLDEKAQRRLVIERARELSALAPGMGEAQLDRILRVFMANMRALERYVPQTGVAPIVLFRARDEVSQELSVHNAAARWKALTSGPVDEQLVPGDHYSMFEPPHIEELARCVGTALGRVHDATRNGSPSPSSSPSSRA